MRGPASGWWRGARRLLPTGQEGRAVLPTSHPRLRGLVAALSTQSSRGPRCPVGFCLSVFYFLASSVPLTRGPTWSGFTPACASNARGGQQGRGSTRGQESALRLSLWPRKLRALPAARLRFPVRDWPPDRLGGTEDGLPRRPGGTPARATESAALRTDGQAGQHALPRARSSPTTARPPS